MILITKRSFWSFAQPEGHECMLISFVKLTGSVFKLVVACDLASQSDSYRLDRSQKHYWLLTGRASRI